MKKVQLKTVLRCPCGKNTSIDRADESNPGSSDESPGITERSPTLPTHYYSIPTKSQHKAATPYKTTSLTHRLDRANTAEPPSPHMIEISLLELCEL